MLFLLCSQVEVQQKIIADFEAGKLAWDARQAELNKEVPAIIIKRKLNSIF